MKGKKEVRSWGHQALPHPHLTQPPNNEAGGQQAHLSSHLGLSVAGRGQCPWLIQKERPHKHTHQACKRTHMHTRMCTHAHTCAHAHTDRCPEARRATCGSPRSLGGCRPPCSQPPSSLPCKTAGTVRPALPSERTEQNMAVSAKTVLNKLHSISLKQLPEPQPRIT